MKRYFLAFVAGSAFPVMIWPSLYSGIPELYNPAADSTVLSVAIVLPAILGLLNVIYVAIERWLPFEERGNYWLWGTVQGLGFALYGNFVANLPSELFLLERAWQYITIPIATLAYALIWRYIIRNLNRAFQITR